MWLHFLFLHKLIHVIIIAIYLRSLGWAPLSYCTLLFLFPLSGYTINNIYRILFVKLSWSKKKKKKKNSHIKLLSYTCKLYSNVNSDNSWHWIYSKQNTDTAIISRQQYIQCIFTAFQNWMQDIEAELSHTKISNAILRSNGMNTRNTRLVCAYLNRLIMPNLTILIWNY